MACTQRDAFRPRSGRDGGFRILVINPGSTSTKIAVYVDSQAVFQETIVHDSSELARLGGVSAQYPIRMRAILESLERHGETVDGFDAVVGRGGLLRPVESGVYEVNDTMVSDLTGPAAVSHASNLGALLAREVANRARVRAFIADPVVVDEFWDVARLSGLPEIPRRSILHALNHKAVARQAAGDMGSRYEDLNLVVAHLGGGITVGAHLRGRVVDVSNGLDGEGPFTPERAGGLPVLGVVELCFSGRYSEGEIMKKLIGRGGLMAHLGTSDAAEVERRIDAGDDRAALVFEAMAYQISKEIGAYAAVLSGDVDAIILTGGLAHSRRLVEWIRDRVSFIAPVLVYPGENEMRALAEACLRVLRGEEQAKVYR